MISLSYKIEVKKVKKLKINKKFLLLNDFSSLESGCKDNIKVLFSKNYLL